MAALFTIGHSTRSAAELIALLRASGVETLVDVRRYPVSRRYPHFRKDKLAEALCAAGIAYAHEPDLGGHREPSAESPNTALQQAAFRGYADHMATPAFAAAVGRLESRADGGRVAFMCAEAMPSSCHRGLLSDALVARGRTVWHILGPGQVQEHVLSAGLRPLPEGGIVYPHAGPQRRLFSRMPAKPVRRPSPPAGRRPR
jgi:uncharacterized protein (DUF488 family)